MDENLSIIPPEVRDRLNEEAGLAAERDAEHLRGQVIDITANAVRSILDEDRATLSLVNANMLEVGTEVPVHVFHHTIAVPDEDGRLIETRSILLERDPTKGQSRDDKLRVHVPCDEMGTPLSLVDRIWVERIEEDGTIDSFSITRNKFYHYVPGSVSPDGLDQLGTDEDFDRILLPLDTHMPEITELYEDLRNMKVVPQKIRIIGGQSTEDAGSLS